MPLSSINYETPFFRLYISKPDLDLLKPFGCLCYMSTQAVNRSKFHPRAKPGVFLGYPLNQKGYKILNLVTHQVTVSRNVVFHELHFPYHILQNNSAEFSSIFLPRTTSISNDYSDVPEQHTPESSPFTSSNSSDSPSSSSSSTEVNSSSSNSSAT